MRRIILCNRGTVVANWRWGILVGLCVGIAGPVVAQETRDAGKDKASDPTQVVVQGKKNDVSDRIDRRVYDIKSDPDSQTGTVGDVLDKLPSVTVNPAGRVTLRGDDSVTVLVDGKYPVNGNNFLQTLAASDIDRIEVITNPSAQYQAQGTGGIINIITKKRHPFGLSGTATGRVSSQGQVSGNTSLSLTEGPWSVTGKVNGGRWEGRYNWTSTETAPDPFQSDGRQHDLGTFGGAVLDVARKFGDHQTITLQGAYYPGWSVNTERDDYASASRAYTSRSDTISSNDYGGVEFIYDYNNDTLGRHFTLDASLGQDRSTSRFLRTDTYSQPTQGQAIYGTYERNGQPNDDIKADFEVHPTSGNVLTSGMEWKRDGVGQDDLYSDLGTIAGPHPGGGTRAFFGRRDISALYVTWQHPLFAGWTMLPGLRAEYAALQIRSSGLDVQPDDWSLYPTLHLSHDCGKGKIKLSYSRRVDRPYFTQYDPARIYTSAIAATEGNPDLKAPTTDSYELGYEYSQGKVSTDATLYYHALTNAVSDFYQDLGNGVTLDRPINSGHNRSAGSEFTIKTPMSKHWKVSFNLNLFYSEVPLIDVAGGEKVRGSVTYVSNSSLEYDWDKGDQVQLDLGLTGKQLSVQGYLAPVSHLDLTWRHNITKKLALVVNAQDMLGGMRWVSVTTSPELRSRWVQPPTDQLVRISLTRNFGGPAK